MAILPALLGYLVTAAAGRPPAAVVAVSFGTLTFTVGFALAAGLVEEPGWRGVGRDLFQSRFKPALGAVLLGGVWAVWHLPLLFLEGTYQHGLGFLTASFWFFNISMVLLSVLYVWLCRPRTTPTGAPWLPELTVGHLDTSLRFYAAAGPPFRFRRESPPFASLRRHPTARRRCRQRVGDEARCGRV